MGLFSGGLSLPGLGGGGSFTGVEGPGNHAQSVTTSSSTTNNIDKRLVLGSGGLGLTGDSNTVTVNALDGGAIAGAIDLSKTSNEQAYKSLVEIAGLQKDLVNLEGATASHVADAYQNASDAATGARQIAIIGLVLIGIAAVGALALYFVNR